MNAYMVMERFSGEFDAEKAIEYLEFVGEWSTIRNVPRDVMIKWAEYLYNKYVDEENDRVGKLLDKWEKLSKTSQ